MTHPLDNVGIFLSLVVKVLNPHACLRGTVESGTEMEKLHIQVDGSGLSVNITMRWMVQRGFPIWKSDYTMKYYSSGISLSRGVTSAKPVIASRLLAKQSCHHSGLLHRRKQHRRFAMKDQDTCQVIY
jgi:hypothetical protein